MNMTAPKVMQPGRKVPRNTEGTLTHSCSLDSYRTKAKQEAWFYGDEWSCRGLLDSRMADVVACVQEEQTQSESLTKEDPAKGG